MSTSLENLSTFKRAKRSVKLFFSNKITVHRPIQKRKSILSLFSKTPCIHTFGILSIVGPLDALNAGWLASDFATWAFLISTMAGYSPKHTLWNTIHPLTPLFPNNFVIFGDAGCDRLRLPLPFSSATNPLMPADSHAFTTKCLVDLSTMAKEVGPGDRLILLLVGHGSPGEGVFRLHVTIKPNEREGEAFITKSSLEMVLKDCRGEILIICNSCYSGLLASDHWTLLCAADSNQMADALSESGSGHFRGSGFTACALAQAAKEHGLQSPLPRAEPRSAPQGQLVPLPLHAPPHSFPTSVTLTSITLAQASDSSLKTFFRRMHETERFLTMGIENVFQTSGASPTVTWTSVLPINFTTETVNQINPVPESEDFQQIFNDRCKPSNLGPQGGASLPPMSPSPPISPLLVQLVRALPSLGHHNAPRPRTQEAVYAQIYHELAQHIRDPELNPSPLQAHMIGEADLVYGLWPMHVQAIAVQEIARALGWHEPHDIAGGVVMPFLPFVWTIDKLQLEEMIKHGVLVNDLAEYLRANYFHHMRPAIDRNSVQWLMDKWVAAGKPVIPRPKWDMLLKKVGDLTAKKAMH